MTQMTNPIVTGTFEEIASAAETTLISIQNNMDCVVEIVVDTRSEAERTAAGDLRGWLVHPGEPSVFEFIGKVNIKKASANTSNSNGFITVTL